MPRLDRVNLRLLDLLQTDARHTFVDLADELDRAESTIRERVARLEEDDVLKGYRARIDMPQVGLPVHALVHAKGDPSAWPEIARRLREIPFVVCAQVTTGERPLRIELRARDLRQLDGILEHRLADLDVAPMATSIVLRELIEDRALPLEQIHQDPQLPRERSQALGIGQPADEAGPISRPTLGHHNRR